MRLHRAAPDISSGFKSYLQNVGDFNPPTSALAAEVFPVPESARDLDLEYLLGYLLGCVLRLVPVSAGRSLLWLVPYGYLCQSLCPVLACALAP